MKQKISKLLNNQSVNLKGDEIVHIVHHTPNMSSKNYKKMEKAYEQNKGCRLKLEQDELMGCGLKDFVHEVKKDVKKVGKKIIKSGIAHVAGEVINNIPYPFVSPIQAAYKLSGGSVDPYLVNNPYLPEQLRGAGISPHHIKMSYISNNTHGK